jgi:hypothetical protein
MKWIQCAVALLLVSLIGFTDGCSRKRASDAETASGDPDGTVWEGQGSQDAAAPPPSTTTRRRRGNHPFDQIQAGETYESIVARFGPPHQQMMQYTWSTMSGTFHVAFDNQLNAINIYAEGATPERDREVRDLVEKRVSLTTIAAHLGGDPKMGEGNANWIAADRHQLSVRFQQGRVIDFQQRRPARQ